MTNDQLIFKIAEECLKNKDFYKDFLAEDIRWNIVGMDSIIGKDNFLDTLNILELENFPALRIKNVISNGDYVVVESYSVNESDKPYNPSYCDIYRIINGKIQELTTYIVDLKKE